MEPLRSVHTKSERDSDINSNWYKDFIFIFHFKTKSRSSSFLLSLGLNIYISKIHVNSMKEPLLSVHTD